MKSDWVGKEAEATTPTVDKTCHSPAHPETDFRLDWVGRSHDSVSFDLSVSLLDEPLVVAHNVKWSHSNTRLKVNLCLNAGCLKYKNNNI